MARQIFVTKHAAERLQQRCGIRVNAHTEIALGSDYVKVFSNTCDGERVDWYMNKKGIERAVLIVINRNNALKTVMTDGPSVDFAMSKLAEYKGEKH
jgi:hypothetical protein